MSGLNAGARRAQIVQWLQDHGQVQVRDLADFLGVSEMTVRRDLEYLAREGTLIRTYGGALPTSGLNREQPYASKAGEHTGEKERIARYAASLVKDGDTVLLDAGSTTLALARALRGRKDLLVFTVDLKIALELCDEPGIRVIVLGGTAQPEVYTLLGPLVEQNLRGLTTDWAFLGTSAVDAEKGLTTPTLEKVPVKLAILQAGRRAVLLADASKFGRRGTFQICPLSALSQIITDRSLDDEMAEAVREGGVDLEQV
ncbi:MAG: DeoR/GlpR family DNA-binding transcription regulator [Bacillota bacterium]